MATKSHMHVDGPIKIGTKTHVTFNEKHVQAMQPLQGNASRITPLKQKQGEKVENNRKAIIFKVVQPDITIKGGEW